MTLFMLLDPTITGPVGTITFLQGTGLMKVRYDRSLVRTQEGDIVDGTLRK